MAQDWRQPTRHSIAKRDRYGLLHLTSPGQGREAVIISHRAQHSNEFDQIEGDHFKRCLNLEYQARVHNVLGRCTPVGILTEAVWDDLDDLFDQPYNGVANNGHLVSQSSEVEVVDLHLAKGNRCVLWDKANLGLDSSERCFDFQVPLNQAAFAKDVPEFVGRVENSGYV